jgi:HlyD family secretion protein
MKLKDSILPLLAVGSLGYAIVSIAATQPVRELTDPPMPPPQSSMEKSVAAIGLVEPSSEAITVGTARSGVVDEIFVTVGDSVKKGQPLLKLRSRELEAERTVAEAAIAEASAQVNVAKQQVVVAQAQASIAEAERAQSQRMLTFAESVKDARVLSDEERTQRAMTVATQDAKLASANANVAAAQSSQVSAEAAVTAAKARLEVADVEIDRCTIKAPLDATVLQLRTRVGEFISAMGTQPWLLIGQTNPLHVRVDVDEHEAWRVVAGAPGEAQVRGNPQLRSKLSFVRFEPYVIPKRSLTGDATERVDTRVLQIIYKVEAAADVRLFSGQQMDVFIQANDPLTAAK